MAKTAPKTTRPKVEKAILAALSSKLRDEYAIPLKPDKYESSMVGRFYTISRNVNKSVFHVTLRFYGKYDFSLETRLVVCNDELSSFLKKNGFPKNTATQFPVINFDFEGFFIRDHGDAVNLQKGGTLESISAEKCADFIFKRYFSFLEKQCIPKMNTVENLNILLNDAARFNKDGSPDFVFVWPRQARIVAGTALALLSKRNGYKKTLTKYLKTIQKHYEPGDYKDIDLCRKLIETELN
jgi:hypothetical protein